MKRDILYVDDEVDNLIVFEANFDDDFNVHTATNGEEALGILAKKPFPIIVCDQRMPGMTGVELLDIVRRQSPLTKRILLTGYTDPDAMADAINRGQIFHFVKKPWERNFLFSLLLRALETHDLEVANSTLTNRMVSAERCAMLGRVTAQITHEMGNQLCVLPLLEYIKERCHDQPDVLDVVHFARDMYARLAALVDEVKSFMRFENETFTVSPIRLTDVVHELVSFLRFDESVPENSLRVEIVGEPVVRGNKVKLQQVLMNLVKNAGYAIKEHAEIGRIVVRVSQQDGDALISVIDNGCGMSAETLSKIWAPFFTTKGEQGNGLGLDVSRRLIESHGGRIDCTSELNAGTEFTIRLPLCKDGEPAGAGRLEPVQNRVTVQRL